AFTELNVEQRPGLGLLKGVAREALYWGDVDGDGTRELLVPGPNFARALALDGKGQALVVGQYNLPDPGSAVACVAPADLDGGRATGRHRLRAVLAALRGAAERARPRGAGAA